VNGDRLMLVLYRASRFLRWRAIIDRTPKSFSEVTGTEDARSVDRLAKRLRKLADEVQAFDDMFADSGIAVAFEQESFELAPQRPEAIEGHTPFGILMRLNDSVPEVLRAEASFLESVIPAVKRQPSISIPDLIESFFVGFVREHSHDHAPHTADVAMLINWLYGLPGCGNFRVTEEALSHRATRQATDVNS
jgi:hypothetical protein